MGARIVTSDTAPAQLGWTFDPERPVFCREVLAKPSAPVNKIQVQAYLWARAVLCWSCTALIPLSPDWRLSNKLGCKLTPHRDDGTTSFEIVRRAEMSPGTIKRGIAVCPHCHGSTPQFYIREEAQAGRLGQLLYVIVYRIWQPVYRPGRPPLQKRSKCQFRVANTIIPKCHQLMQDFRNSAGIPNRFLHTDPSLLELGLFGGTESEFAPGIAQLDDVGL